MNVKDIYEHFLNIAKKAQSDDIALSIEDIDSTLKFGDIVFFDIIKCRDKNDMFASFKESVNMTDDRYCTDEAKAILINFHIDTDIPIKEITKIVDFVDESADEDANLLWTTTSRSQSEDIEISFLVVR